MKAIIFKTEVPVMYFFFLLLPCDVEAQRSSFDYNDEGWRVAGDAQGPSIIPYFDSTGGNPGGYCYAVDDVAGDYWYWVAPDTFLGDKSASFARYLRFDLKQSNTTSQTNKADVIMEGNGIKIYYDTSYNPDTSWTHYDVLLDTAGWERNNYGSGQAVTKSDFQQLLGNVTKLWIRGEYRFGPDVGSIDNVVLEPAVSSVPAVSPAKYYMEIYPNPAGDLFSLSLRGEPQKAVMVDIFSSTGQKLLSESIDFQSGVILKEYSCRDWAAGVYWVRVSNEKGGVSRKVVIE